MSTLKSIIFETLPDPEEYWETAEALRDLDRQYQHFTRTVWKASKQLLKFDEINRLVAYEVEEKEPKTTTGRSSGGSSRSSSSSKSSTPKSTTPKAGSAASTDEDPFAHDFALEFNLKDILFNWLGISWEKILATIIAALTTISEVMVVLRAILPEYVTVRYIDPQDGNITKTMYSNNIPAICATVNPDGTAIWKGLSFPLIER